MSSVVARTITTAVLYIGILFSITLLLAGHNEPGGGFIAGAMTASVFALLYLVHGKKYVESRFTADYRSVALLGLAIAVAFALLPLAFGLPILSGMIYSLDLTLVVNLPVLGPVRLLEAFKLASAVGFDFGVYLAVVGSILSILKWGAGGEFDG
jgi:multicomponent Na+:H+ antiporter subunit B